MRRKKALEKKCFPISWHVIIMMQTRKIRYTFAGGIPINPACIMCGKTISKKQSSFLELKSLNFAEKII